MLLSVVVQMDTSEMCKLMKDQMLLAHVSFFILSLLCKITFIIPTSLIHSAPPGDVRDLQTTTVTSTSVTVRWTIPEVTGRSDFYYTLQYSDPDNIGEFLPANPIRIVDTALSVSHTLRGLQPYTTYTIRVTSHNGVSDQDTENAALRRVDIQVRTLEGGKCQILPVTSCILCSNSIQFQVLREMSEFSLV